MKIVNHHAGCCGYHPVRPDGTQWPHVLGLPGGGSVHADTPGEILAELIPGYAELPDDITRRAARDRHAAELAVRHQRFRIDSAIAQGLVDEADPDDADLIALLREVAGRPLGLSSPDPAVGAPGPPRWDGAIRLVCLTTAYAPHGELPAPTGHVDWIDPIEEEGYLVSLRRADALDYWSEAVHS